MRVGVIGAGLFGCTVAIHAARAGHEVTLIDKASGIMSEATRANQQRLHRGYHYPRSPETVEECRAGLASFLREYREAVLPGIDQYYAIAKGSRTSVDAYTRFMDEHGLDWHLADKGSMLFNGENIEAAFKVTESRIDPHKLKSIVAQDLGRHGVTLRLERAAQLSMRDEFDRIIIAGYAGTNEIASALGCETIDLQYEIVEKPIIRLPTQYRDLGVVVMDGPFGCVDPYLGGLHLMGHVEHAIHGRWTGREGRGVNIPGTAFEAMATALTHHLPFMRQAEHVGSLKTVRVVLPAKDVTDERPTLVTRLDDQVVRIFAGKLGHAVDAARDALTLVSGERMAA